MKNYDGSFDDFCGDMFMLPTLNSYSLYRNLNDVTGWEHPPEELRAVTIRFYAPTVKEAEQGLMRECLEYMDGKKHVYVRLIPQVNKIDIVDGTDGFRFCGRARLLAVD